jgi:hypothetical protein
MKKLFRFHVAALAALLAFIAPMNAQTLTVTAPGYSGAKLFDSTAGFTITGLAADPNGDVYYLETDGAFTLSTKLYRRTAATNYLVPATPLFDFGTVVFGSFVTIGNGKIYFGESTFGTPNQIRVINSDGTGVELLGSVLNNYDAAFSGGSLYISHNSVASGAANKVSKFDLVPNGAGGTMLSSADSIVDTVSDYSGPVEFDAAGALFYGASAVNGIVDLYRFNAAEIAGAFGPTNLTLDGAHRALANGANAYLAAGGGTSLWQTFYPTFPAAATLNLIDTTAGTAKPIGSSANSIGQLDFANGELFVSVTNFGTNRSAVYGVVPEPSSTLSVAIALGSFGWRRRRKSSGPEL